VFGEQLTLYCALALAGKEISGFYNENAGYTQEISLQIQKQFPDRHHLNTPAGYICINPILNFNNHKQTTFLEIKKIHELRLTQLYLSKLYDTRRYHSIFIFYFGFISPIIIFLLYRRFKRTKEYKRSVHLQTVKK